MRLHGLDQHLDGLVEQGPGHSTMVLIYTTKTLYGTAEGGRWEVRDRGKGRETEKREKGRGEKEI